MNGHESNGQTNGYGHGEEKKQPKNGLLYSIGANPPPAWSSCELPLPSWAHATTIATI